MMRVKFSAWLTTTNGRILVLISFFSAAYCGGCRSLHGGLVRTLRLGLVLSNVVSYSPLARKFLLEVRLEFAVEGNGFLLFEGNHFQSFTDVPVSISTPCTLDR